MTKKIPPSSEEAERAVLGSILVDPDRCIHIAVSNGITEDAFYAPSNKAIWKCINSLAASGKPVNIVSVGQEARDSGILEIIGGQGTIESLVDSTPTSAHIEYYSDIVIQKFLARSAQDISRKLVHELDNTQSPQNSIASAALEMMRLSESKAGTKKKEDIIEEQKSTWTIAAKGGSCGIPTPWNNINARFQGLQNGAMTLLAGRGGRGKSSIMATWCHFLAGMGYRVAWLPLEDGCRRTWARVAGIEGNFSTFKLDIGQADDQLLKLAGDSLDTVKSWPIFMEDQPMTIEQICAWATMQKAKNKIDVLFLDAFKDILREDHDVLGDNQCSQQIAAMAKRLNIPILVNHHVRKQNTTDPRQQVVKLTEQDIRGSGRLSDDARQIIILQNYVENGIDKYAFHIIKNNYGPVGEYPMIRLSNISKFIEPPVFAKPVAKMGLPYSDNE